MTRDEAKFILGAYRPSGADAGDAVFADALRNAEADPGLRTWFERSRAHDSTVAAKLREVNPPAGLREAVLAGVRVSGARRGLRRRFAWGAVAVVAVVALIFGATALRVTPRAMETEERARFALDDMVNGRHGGAGEEAGALQSKLSSATAGMPRASEIDFAKLAATGCRTLHFAGREVLEICFSRAGTQFHLYVFDRERPAKGNAATGKPSFLARAGGAAAVWSDGRYDFAVVSAAGMDAVKRLF